MFVAEQNMQAVMAEALRRHLEEHAQEEGIDFVLNWGLSGEGVLYGTEPWDITSDVLERINAAHPDPIQARLEAEAKHVRRMTVAQRKKQEHIVDHVLYCLQMEDLIRAAQFQPRLLQQWAEQQAEAEGTDPARGRDGGC